MDIRQSGCLRWNKSVVSVDRYMVIPFTISITLVCGGCPGLIKHDMKRKGLALASDKSWFLWPKTRGSSWNMGKWCTQESGRWYIQEHQGHCICMTLLTWLRDHLKRCLQGAQWNLLQRGGEGVSRAHFILFDKVRHGMVNFSNHGKHRYTLVFSWHKYVNNHDILWFTCRPWHVMVYHYLPCFLNRTMLYYIMIVTCKWINKPVLLCYKGISVLN